MDYQNHQLDKALKRNMKSKHYVWFQFGKMKYFSQNVNNVCLQSQTMSIFTLPKLNQSFRTFLDMI